MYFSFSSRRGFTFSGSTISSTESCDIVIKKRSSVSRKHFSITFRNKRLFLRDFSTHGTAVEQDEQCANEVRKNFSWWLFGKEIFIKVYSLKLEIHLPQHDLCTEAYLEAIDRFEFEAWKAAPHLIGLGLDSAASTAAPTQPASPTSMSSPLYHRTGFLGNGTFGVVYKVFNVSTTKEFAAKKVFKGDIRKEVQALKEHSHESIIRFIDFTHQRIDSVPNSGYAIMEYVAMGNLEEQWRCRFLSISEILHLARQASLAVEYMHGIGYTHRDLKPTNILFSTRDPVAIKLADFGLASAKSLKTRCGTERYAAPEIWHEEWIVGRYTNAVDIWSLGVILWDLLHERCPNPDASKQEKMDMYKWYATLETEVQNDTSEPVTAMIGASMLRMAAERRATASECLSRIDLLPSHLWNISIPAHETQIVANSGSTLMMSSGEFQGWSGKRREGPQDQPEIHESEAGAGDTRQQSVAETKLSEEPKEHEAQAHARDTELPSEAERAAPGEPRTHRAQARARKTEPSFERGKRLPATSSAGESADSAATPRKKRRRVQSREVDS